MSPYLLPWLVLLLPADQPAPRGDGPWTVALFFLAFILCVMVLGSSWANYNNPSSRRARGRRR